MKVVDATNAIIGRLATQVAKYALLGEEVAIVNSEKAIVSGKKINVFDEYVNRIQRGTHRGPHHPRLPDRILRRTVRGMLPYKKAKGREAFERVMCYVGVPPEFEGKTFEKVESADMSKLPTLKYVTLADISKRLGAKFE